MMATMVLLDLPERNRICSNARLWMENGTYGGEQRLSLPYEDSAALEDFRLSPLYPSRGCRVYVVECRQTFCGDGSQPGGFHGARGDISIRTVEIHRHGQ